MRLWLLAGAAAAVLSVALTATGNTGVAARPAVAESAAAPFAQAWAQVPRSPTARRAKSVLVYGFGADVTGFNTALACCRRRCR